MESLPSWKRFSPVFQAFLIILMLPLVANSQDLSKGSSDLNRLFFQRALAERVPFSHLTLDALHPVVEWSEFNTGSQLEDTWDQKWLRKAYFHENRLFTATMSGADKVAYPVIFGVPVLIAGTHLADLGPSRNDVLKMAFSWIGAAGTSMVLKRIVLRPRPYSVMEDVSLRAQYAGAKGLNDRSSFPSGHAALSFAIATTLSLRNPSWTVVIPSTLVASSISLSRIWLGVHYPSDVLTGASLGIGSAILVHFLVFR